MRRTVRTLIQSAKRLAGVMVLTLLFLCLLALVGQQLFMGALRNKCIIWPVNMTQTNHHDDGYSSSIFDYDGSSSSNFDYNKYVNNHTNYYFLPGQLDALLCGNSSEAGKCPEGFSCIRAGPNPNYGYTNFDSFGWSLLSMIRMLTQDFWDNLMMLTLRSAGKSLLAYYVVLVFPGCFCLFSLIVAAVAVAIMDQEDAEVAEAQQREKEFDEIQQALRSNQEENLSDGPEEEKKKTDGSCSPCCVRCLTWNCCGCWRGLKQQLHAMVTSPFFDLVIVICLIVNIIFMAMEHYPLSPQFEETLSIAALVFDFIFFLEMVVKILALDPYGYFKVGWNVFESVIVVISLLSLSLADVYRLRPVILLRVFRLARWWPSFLLLLKLVSLTLKKLLNLVLVLVIVVYLFSLVGMQLFHRDYKDCVCKIAHDCELPRWHMNDFLHTFLIVFRILNGEWIEVLWDCMEVAGQASCMIFILVLMIIGYLLLLNLFLSMLLSSCLAVNLDPYEQTQKTNVNLALEQICTTFRTLLGKEEPGPKAAENKDSQKKDHMALDVVSSDKPLSEVQALIGDTSESRRAPIAEDEDKETAPEDAAERGNEGKSDVLDPPEAQKSDSSKSVERNVPEDCCCDKCYQCCPLLDVGKSHGVGRVWSTFRRTCLAMVQHRCMEALMIVVILLSSFILVFEDIYLPQRTVLRAVLQTADQVFTFVFLVEMLLKWSALGLKRYFTDAWCWLDFLILMVSLTCLTDQFSGPSELRAYVWSLRALIPLRILSRFEGLRVVMQTLVRSLPALFNALSVILTVLLVFSIMGVNMFAGRFYYCFNETSEEHFHADVVNNKSECVELINLNFSEVRWKNIPMNFDSVGNGYLSLLVTTMSTDWFDIVYAAVDSKWVEDQPVYEYNVNMYMYFELIFIGTLLAFIFFIRLLINGLQAQERPGQHLFMSEHQQKLFEAVRNNLSRKQQKPPRPQVKCRAWLYDLVTNIWFEVFMVVLILLNMLTYMVETLDQSFEKEEILYWFHFIFILIFLVEFILKVTALGRHYFFSGWNILDFVVLIVSIVGVFLYDLMEKYFISPGMVPLLRMARIARVVHLIRWNKRVRKFLWAFLLSLPALFNISFILLVVTVSFSIFGMFNFAYAKPSAGIDDMWNFETFRNSLICMLMTSTTSGWVGLLLPMMLKPPDCDPFKENPGLTGKGDCGNPLLGITFFCAFIVVSSLLLIHLYIAVILEVCRPDQSKASCEPISSTVQTEQEELATAAVTPLHGDTEEEVGGAAGGANGCSGV
ncbi:sodium channel protein type 4 subunit alpha A-like isoform X2 [Cheilinus undulatus]|uniref:sodium channel protein type 4 subunit alpha A-like isoform X2 n=1 Tax=Cheilinus undulatus TaxID=241271 RepID=UPI001BD69695|nr:sodium channel protein type 4 subunit alpha A-like isoform X2 [Cheilinus undulatus]